MAQYSRIFARLGGMRHALGSVPALLHPATSSPVSTVRSLSTLASSYPSPINPRSSVRPQRRFPNGGTSASSGGNFKMFWYASSAIVVTIPLTTTAGFAELSTIPSSSPSFFDDSKRSLSTSTSASTSSPQSTNNLDIVLYQFQVCPFCNKVRAYLDYHKIPYRVVEVDPLRKTELRQFSADYRKVPIAVINSKQVNGSSNVISTVESLISGKKQDTESPSSSFSSIEDRWMKWLDDHFIHLIAPNIYRTPTESLQTFNYITDKSKFTWWQRASIRYSGAAAMYVIGRRLKKKYEITDERREIHDAISDWMKAIHDGGSDFLNGQQKPGVVDLSMYGVLKAIETFDTFDDLRKQNVDFASWYDRVQEMVGASTQTLEI